MQGFIPFRIWKSKFPITLRLHCPEDALRCQLLAAAGFIKSVVLHDRMSVQELATEISKKLATIEGAAPFFPEDLSAAHWSLLLLHAGKDHAMRLIRGVTPSKISWDDIQ